MTLKDLLENAKKYTLLREEDRCLFHYQDFCIHTYGQVFDNRLRFLIIKKDKLTMNMLEIMAGNNGNFFRWQGETSWLYYYYDQLPNVCTYLAYLYIFSCIIKNEQSRNKR